MLMAQATTSLVYTEESCAYVVVAFILGTFLIISPGVAASLSFA